MECSTSFLLIFLAGCTKVVDDFRIDKKPAKIVAQGQIQADSLCSVNLSRSLSFFDDQVYREISNATIELYDGNTLADNLIYQNEGWYRNSNVKTIAGHQYILKFHAEGYPDASTAFKVPDKPAVTNISYSTSEEIPEECEGCMPEKMLNITISIKDDVATEDYYSVASLVYIDKDAWWGAYDSLEVLNPSDTSILLTPIGMSSTTRLIEIGHDEYGSFTQFSEDEDAYGSTFIFSDKLVNGKTISLSLKINGYNLPYYWEAHRAKIFENIILRVSKTDRNYYEYALNMAHINANGDNPLSEPVSVYRSVENGLGVVYAENTIEEIRNIRDIDPYFYNDAQITWKY